MENRSRRKFLIGAGVTVAGITAGSRIFAEPCNITIDAMQQALPQKAANRSAIRGLMVDAGRVPESVEYYKRVIEFCSDWELNALQFRLADDQGSALRFASVPDLVTHNDSLTPEQLKSLAEYAQSHGVDLIPELESFGHTGYITRSPAYAHLLDQDPRGSSEFTGVIPVHPETLQIFERLYREVATIFSSSYLHGGCDEVNWGGSTLSRKVLQEKTRAQVWAEYLNSLNKISQGLKKDFIVWGDFVLHTEPQILSLLNKDIIIMDWNYSDNSSARIQESLLKVRANGSRGIGAPSLVSYKWGARVGTEQLRNIDAYAEAYLGANAAGSLGVMLTNWVPSRYIQNSIWDGFAYAAIAFKEGTATAQTSGFRRFVEKHYHASWNEVWEEAFQTIYAAAPYVKDRETASWMGLTLPVPWSSEEQLHALLKSSSPRPNLFTHLRALLIQLEPLVLNNLRDFQAFALCVEYLERMFWRETVILEQCTGKTLTPESARLLIQSIADRDHALAEALTKDWDSGRSPNSAAKTAPLFGFEPKDQLLFQWEKAAAYSASLANNPEHFYQLVQGVTS